MTAQPRIRQRLLEILEIHNEPMSPGDIKQRAQLVWGVDSINCALNAMERDGQVRLWKPGFFVPSNYKVAAVPTPKPANKKQVAVKRQPKAATVVTPVSRQRPVKKEEPKNMPKPSDAPVQGSLRAELQEMTRRINAGPFVVEDYAAKLSVLEALKAVAPPSVAEVLQAMINDYAALGGAQ